MANITFNDSQTDNEKWGVIEKAMPGSKDFLEQVTLILALTGYVPSISKNSKTKNKHKTYKYHLFSEKKKLFTIYIPSKGSKEDIKIRIFTYMDRQCDALIVHIANIDDLKETLSDWISDL